LGIGTHGIMLHHFHDDVKHIKGQGSISAETFADMLDFYGKKYHILSAEEYLYKSNHNSLGDRDVCITFDDGLLCQYEVAYPVMKDRGLTSFMFVYTSPLDGVMEKVEIYRHFRFLKFSDIDIFYEAFFKTVEQHYPEAYAKLKFFDPSKYLIEYPFYTVNDKRFRYLRDDVLGQDKYYEIMDQMLITYDYDVEANAKLLWMHADHLKDLRNAGHIIGLHSYSHPTTMAYKTYDGQYQEYAKNKEQLEAVLGEPIVAASYPCDSYNADTLRCMRELGIQIGFRANPTNVCLEDIHLEYPREDHANILKMMEENK